MSTILTNRTEAPSLHIPDSVALGTFREERLSNGVPVYSTQHTEEDVVKLELTFHAGRWYEPAAMMSRATCSLLTKGTSNYSSKELADRIEFYGASVDTSNGHDNTSVKIFTLGRYLGEVLPLVREMLLDASFPEQEFEQFRQKQVQKLQVGLQNTDFVANRKLHEVLFGAKHPYGYMATMELIASLDRQQLLDFSRKAYQPANAMVFASGNTTPGTISLLEQYFGDGAATLTASPQHALETDPGTRFLELNDRSVQSSVRIGGLTINKQHPDFPALNVANTVLGGYFGSRLMSNIREEKGYTYGIYSMIRHHQHGSYFVIDTETGNEVCRQAVEETYKEMRLLATEPVDMEELDVVKNYMMGSLIRATDGSFNRIQVIRNMVLSGLDFDYFTRLAEAVRSSTPETVMEMSRRYLQPELYKEIISGQPTD